MEIKQHVERDLAESLPRKSLPVFRLDHLHNSSDFFFGEVGLIKLGNVKLSVKIEMVHLINARVSLAGCLPVSQASQHQLMPLPLPCLISNLCKDIWAWLTDSQPVRKYFSLSWHKKLPGDALFWVFSVWFYGLGLLYFLIIISILFFFFFLPVAVIALIKATLSIAFGPAPLSGYLSMS